MNKVEIRTPKGLAQICVNARYAIYDILVENGVSDKIAAAITKWAPEAAVGDTYNTEHPDVSICIVR